MGVRGAAAGRVGGEGGDGGYEEDHAENEVGD